MNEQFHQTFHELHFPKKENTNSDMYCQKLVSGEKHRRNRAQEVKVNTEYSSLLNEKRCKENFLVLEM